MTITDDLIISLTNDHFSYVFKVTHEGLLQHLYYGSPVKTPIELGLHHRVDRGATSHFQGIKDFNLNDLPQEYPSYGTSDYRLPALHGQGSKGHGISGLTYVGHDISKSKPSLNGLPAVRCGESETLIVHMRDKLQQLDVDLLYTIYENHGVLARSSKITNSSDKPFQLQQAFSSSLDLPAGDYEALHLHGTWSREFNAERLALPHGRFTIDSSRGTSSAAHNPFMAIMDKGATEEAGNIYASTLVYSGNFSISAETGEFGDVRILTGINPFNFNWHLGAGESFDTPEALHVFTSNGLGGMSHIWHDFIQEKITPERFKNTPRPTYLNSWEAAYFDITEDKVLSLADKAAEIGVDMLVLDDGWFAGRQDDTTSLGDWTADGTRFPSGIPALAAKIKAKGLNFGLWFEPEMVSSDSHLFRIHPDWALQVPRRTASLGRNQLTLDLSRGDVVDYIYDSLAAILSCGDVNYVKWDMNRNMTDVGSAALPPERQREVQHRYMIGLYELLDRLTKAYPDVLFENCASGGNRFDLGMLSFMPQGWISDMCDPIGRLDIINGASYLYPLDVMTAYIGPSPNHQNGRISSVKSRFLAGIFCAAKGVSLGEADIDANKSDIIKNMLFAKDIAPDMLGGRFDRIFKTDNETCWQYVTRDRQAVYLAYFHTLSAPNLPFRRAMMRGLDTEAIYELQDDATRYHGDTLMGQGMALPYVTMSARHDGVRYMDKGDFSAHVFVFKRIG